MVKKNGLSYNMSLSLAYSHINLRFNPFGELDPSLRSTLAVVEVEHLLPLLQKQKTAIQFLADHGRGKSTHLLALHSYFDEANYVKLQKSKNITIEAYDLNFIDSLEILSKIQRKKLFKKLKRIVYTTHSDISFELEKLGFKVTTVNVECHDEKKLQKIFQMRIDSARRSQGTVPQISIATVRSLMKTYSDNIRAMESDLYDRIQQMREPSNV